MRIEEKNRLRILTPDDGFLLKRNGDDNNFSEIVYLGKNDSPQNYEEVSQEEKTGNRRKTERPME